MKCFLVTEAGKKEYSSVSKLESELHKTLPASIRTPRTTFLVESAVSKSKWIITFTERGAMRRKKCN